MLQGILCQSLLVAKGGKGRCLCVEVMVPNAAIRNLIREDKVHQLYSVMQTGQAGSGMQTFNQSLADLYIHNKIDMETAMARSSMPDELQELINRNVTLGGRQMNVPAPGMPGGPAYDWQDIAAIALAPAPYEKWLTCRIAMEEYGHHVHFRRASEDDGQTFAHVLQPHAAARPRHGIGVSRVLHRNRQPIPAPHDVERHVRRCIRDSGLTVVGTSQPPASQTAQQLVWNLGALNAGAQGQIVITTTVGGAGGRTLINTADITGQAGSFGHHAELSTTVSFFKQYLPVVLKAAAP